MQKYVSFYCTCSTYSCGSVTAHYDIILTVMTYMAADNETAARDELMDKVLEALKKNITINGTNIEADDVKKALDGK